jgi:hypothetical protein
VLRDKRDDPSLPPERDAAAVRCVTVLLTNRKRLAEVILVMIE